MFDLQLLLLNGIGILLMIMLYVANYRLTQRAERAETVAYSLQRHLEQIGCRVEVREVRSGVEVLTIWPELNDFVLADEPEQVQMQHET